MEYFEIVFPETLPSVNTAGFPRVGHILSKISTNRHMYIMIITPYFFTTSKITGGWL